MANPWDNDPVVGNVAAPAAAPTASPAVSTPAAQAAPWAADPVVTDQQTTGGANPGYQPSSVPWLDGPAAFADSAINAVPIVGPWMMKGVDAMDAGLNNMLGFQPETASDRAQIIDANNAAHPVESVAGTVTGTVLPFAVGAGMLPTAGKVALGVEGSLPVRMAAGAASSSLIGGTDAISRGQSPQDAIHTAMVDAAVGGSAPLLFAGLGAGWRAATGQPVLASAPRVVARALADDKIDPMTINTKLADLGPDAVVADLGPNLRDQAGALAAMPGQAKSTIVDALMARQAGRNQRIIGSTDDILGPSPVPSRVDAQIQGQMDQFGPVYRGLFRNATAVDTTPLAENLEADIVNRRGDAQKALQQVRGMLNVQTSAADRAAGQQALDNEWRANGSPGNRPIYQAPLDPNPYTLFQTRQAIDGMLTTETNPKAVQALTDARKQVDDILAPAVPGLKAVDAQFEELAQQRAGLKQGQSLLDSGKNAAPPAQLSDMLESAAQPKGIGVGPSAEPFRMAQGTRAEIDRIVGTTTNDLTALKTALKGDGSWNRDRLAQLYGPTKADQLLDLLDTEKTYDETANTALRNSLTASRVAGQREMSTDAGGIPISASPTGLILHAMTKGANAGLAFTKGGTNAKIASTLMSNQIPDGEAAILAAMMKQRARPALFAPAAVPLLTSRLAGQ